MNWEAPSFHSQVPQTRGGGSGEIKSPLSLLGFNSSQRDNQPDSEGSRFECEEEVELVTLASELAP